MLMVDEDSYHKVPDNPVIKIKIIGLLLYYCNQTAVSVYLFICVPLNWSQPSKTRYIA